MIREVTYRISDLLIGTWHEVRYSAVDPVVEKATDALLWSVEKLNRHKNRCLSQRIHRLADRYDPRPTGEWEA